MTDTFQLAVLAMKKLWQKKRKAEGKSTENPNLVMNSAVQVCWEVSIALTASMMYAHSLYRKPAATSMLRRSTSIAPRTAT